MKVLILCVLYNSYNVIYDYIKSLQNAKKCLQNDIDVDVVIIDNSEKKIDFDKNFNGINTIKIDSDKNLGYFGGIEFGIRKLYNHFFEYDYIIISNVDVKVNEDFFENLKSYQLDSNIGCIAPSICSAVESENRNPKIINRITLKKLKILRIMYKYPMLHYIYEKTAYILRRKVISHNRRCEIYAPHGSFIIFCKASYNFLINMHYPIFLFGEEIYIAENIRNMGLKIIFDPIFTVFDSEHVSTKTLKSKIYYMYNYKAIDWLIKEYFNE